MLAVIFVVYLAVGVFFLMRSASRGFVADMMFALLWPIFVVLHFAGM